MAVAKSKTIKAPKVVKPRNTKTAAKSIDLRFNGTEPIDISVRGYQHALNWYNYEYDVDQAREWLLEYLKRNDYAKTVIAAVRRCPKYRLPTTIGWMCRIMMNGNTLTERSMETFNTWLGEIIAQGEKTVEETTVVEDKPVVSIQERVQAKLYQLITECEAAVDADPALNIYEWLQAKEATAMAATAIRDYYSKTIADLEYEDEFATRQDKKRNADLLKYWTQFIYGCERYIGNKKVTKVRKPREKKQKSAVDLVKKLTFQKEFTPLKIVSINPAEIVGSSQLWTYNTKTRKLTVFNAVGPAGLQVKGAGIIGFDVEKSCTKRLRKPEASIQQLLAAGKVSLRKFMEETAAVASEAKGRINSDTILLRVIK